MATPATKETATCPVEPQLDAIPPVSRGGGRLIASMMSPVKLVQVVVAGVRQTSTWQIAQEYLSGDRVAVTAVNK